MLYYSHVNEDNRIERSLLQLRGCSTVVVVAGSGERVLSLLDIDSCDEYHAVDVNKEALFLLELKLAALHMLTVEEYFEFTGHENTENRNRLQWFDKLKHTLTPPCRSYWTENLDTVKDGILMMGHFEKFLTRVRKTTNLFLGKNFLQVFNDQPLDIKKFPSYRWKIISYLFSKRLVYKAWGNKDFAFIDDKADTRHIPASLTRLIYENRSNASFMMHLIFKGHLRDMNEHDLPPSMDKTILIRVKKRLVEGKFKLFYHHCDMLSFAENNQFRIYNTVFYSLSDLLSFESNAYLQKLLNLVSIHRNIVVWRAFLRNRSETLDKIKSVFVRPCDFNDHTSLESTGIYQVYSIKSPIHEYACI